MSADVSSSSRHGLEQSLQMLSGQKENKPGDANRDTCLFGLRHQYAKERIHKADLRVSRSCFTRAEERGSCLDSRFDHLARVKRCVSSVARFMHRCGHKLELASLVAKTCLSAY